MYYGIYLRCLIDYCNYSTLAGQTTVPVPRDHIALCVAERGAGHARAHQAVRG